MSKRLFVGNLPFSLTQEGLTNLFSKYGKLGEVTVVTNKFNGRSKGFGFVTIEDDAQAATAISEMNGSDLEGRKLTVNEATPFDPNKPRPERRGGFGGGYGGERRSFGGPRRFGGGGGGGRRFGGRDNRRESSNSEEF
ncbi:RNA-binding protein [Candidatus Pacearchaeota archaeon]|nr:RNA-binding protein [Candidatus Pacearchaeota archaeon]